MSESEFVEQIDNLFSTAEVFKSEVLFIDAFEFCYHISNNKSIQQIITQLRNCNIKLIGFVLSSHMLGNLHILKLFQNINTPCINLTTFETRKEGESWLMCNSNNISDGQLCKHFNKP